jgi:predicted GNAT family acetyltransferase
MSVTVADHPERMRYELLDGDELAAFTQYRLRGGVVEFVHTETLPGFEGRGLAAQLVRGALDDVRRRARSVRPLCPYVRSFLQRHREYQDLVPEAERSELLETD